MTESDMPSALGLVVGPIGYRPSRGFFIIFSIIIIISISILLPIVDKQPHSSDFSIATTNHTSPERGQRLDSSGDVKDNDKHKHKDKYGEKDKDIHEESLPVFTSLGTLSSNE